MIQAFSFVNPEPIGTMSKRQICDYADALKDFLTNEECTKNLSDGTMLELYEELKLWEERAAFVKKITTYDTMR